MNIEGLMLTRPGCKVCRWMWMDGHDMVCRRYPPQVSIIMLPAPPPRVGQMMPQVLAAFPVVQEAMWCGEWASVSALAAAGS